MTTRTRTWGGHSDGLEEDNHRLRQPYVMTTISVENHLHRIQQRWCGQTKRERKILVKLYSCGEIEYLHIQHLFHQKCPNLTCSILPPQSFLHIWQSVSHVVTCFNCIFRTLFPHCIHADSTVCKWSAFWQGSALRVIQQSPLQSVAEPRVQSPEQSVTGTAKARRCPSRAGATPQACPRFDQVL